MQFSVPSPATFWSLLDHGGSEERGWYFQGGQMSKPVLIYTPKMLASMQFDPNVSPVMFVTAEAVRGCPFAIKALRLYQEAGGIIEYTECPW